MSKIEKAITWMLTTANDPLHGYDQIYRWGEKGDYDCSSAVITAWEQAGVPVKSRGATYTGNMYSVFLACGFQDVTKSVNLKTGAGLQKGDVLLNVKNHTAMWTGTQVVQASINEKGTVSGGIPGDQTGKEIWTRSYYNYPWNYVLRFVESQAEKDEEKAAEKLPWGINKTEKTTGVVTCDVLNVRSWAGTQYSNIKSYPILKLGNRVGVCSRFHDTKKRVWYYVHIAKKYYGFVDSDYIRLDY